MAGLSTLPDISLNLKYDGVEFGALPLGFGTEIDLANNDFNLGVPPSQELSNNEEEENLSLLKTL